MHRKIVDRNLLSPELPDKIKARSFVRGRLGPKHAGAILIPTVIKGRDPSLIPFRCMD